jgi:hypothetical protein
MPEGVLLADAECRKAVYFIAPPDIRAAYRDPIDLLFCEIMVGYRDLCDRFYRGAAPPLHALPIATAERAARWDALVAAALTLAVELWNKGERMPWRRFCERATESGAAPG